MQRKAHISIIRARETGPPKQQAVRTVMYR